MSSALSKTPPPTAELRLIQAISEFEADLSSIEKAKYRTLKSQSLSTAPSPGDVMCLTAEIDRRISDKFSGRCYGPRFTNFLQGVQQFAALGDVLVGGSQNLIACGVWSLVRMSVLSIVTVSSYVDKLSSIFMDIGRSAPRHQALTLLYPQSKKLPSYLSEYFTVVVNFCRLLFKFGQKSAVQQFASALSESRLKSFQVELDRWALCIKEETSLEDIKEGTGFRVVSKKFFQSTSDRQTRHTRLKVLDYCSTYDHEVTWKQIRKAGNTSSYMQCADYAKWRNSAESKTLIFVGKLGSGKSVSLANIVDDLNLFAAQERHPVAFFFCKHDVSASLSARTIIGSLTRQLLNAVPDLSKVSQSCEDSYATGDVDKVLDILIRAFPSHCKAYFVLDGFDECNTTEQGILIHAINKIQTTQKLVVCVSQRQESGLEARSAVGAFYKPHMVSSIDISSDIEAFIEAELERCLDQKLLNLGDPTLILEIQTALSEGSQGMFLWAALQIQSLCLMKTDYAIREALADLPRTLSETFSRILQKSGNSDPSLQTKTLQVVLAACRPLTTDELREALSVTPGDSFLDSSRILNDVYSALACCGCLLIVDEEELTVRVVHHSVKQYILGELDIPKRVSFSYQEAQRTLADIVTTYLNYDVFGTELSNAKALPILTHSVPSKVLQTTLDFSNTTRQLALKILSSRKQSAFDMSKTIAEACGPSQPKPENPFRFYAYAKTYWQDHSWFVSGHNAAMFNLCSNLVKSRSSEPNKDQNYWAHFHWAVENGNEKLSALLLQFGNVDTEITNEDGHTPLLQAIVDGNKKAVKVMLSAGKSNVEARSKNGSTPLIVATNLGDIDMVKLLLSINRAEVDAKKDDGETALIVAVSRKSTDIIKVLLDVGKAGVDERDAEGTTAPMRAVIDGHLGVLKLLLSCREADVNIKNEEGTTLLMLAAKYGDMRVVEILFSLDKPDLEVRDGTGKTALMWAAELGEIGVVRMLLSVGEADVNATDYQGKTALMWAAECGWIGVVRMLLTTGEADANAVDNKGKTALAWARSTSQFATIQMLEYYLA